MSYSSTSYDISTPYVPFKVQPHINPTPISTACNYSAWIDPFENIKKLSEDPDLWEMLQEFKKNKVRKELSRFPKE